nr:hypothetical protein [Tanacetum cinerariifolium]
MSNNNIVVVKAVGTRMKISNVDKCSSTNLVVKITEDPGEKSSQSPPQIDNQCCYGCGDPLDASDRVSEIKNAFGNKQYKPEDVQELFRKLFNDVQNIHEELAEYINIPSWNCPAFSSYDDEDYTIAITPEEPDNSLSIGDKHLDTISVRESDEVIKSSVENQIPILSESEGIPDNACDVPFRDNSPPLDVRNDKFEELSNSNDDSTSIDDDYFSIENIDYVEASPPDSELVSLEEVQDDNLHEKLLNINFLIAKIKSLNDNPTPNRYDSFLFGIEPNQGKLTGIVMKDNLAELRVHVPNVLTIHPTLMLDSNFIPFDNSLPEFEIFYFDIEEKNSGSTTIHADISLSDLESFNFNNKPNLAEEDHSPLFAYVVWIFLSILMYLMVPSNLLSFGNEDTIFDPGISNYHFPFLLTDVSHRCETYMKFNVYPKLLNESTMEILSSKLSPMTNEFGDWVKLSDPKQALRGRHPMLILVLVMNKICCVKTRFSFSCVLWFCMFKNLWILKTCAKDFVLQSLLRQLHLAIIYPNLIELTSIFWHTL